jgi:LacI family transcriptional regulator
MPVRLKDIARDLGVSAVTVSKVLRNHPDIGEETRKRVLARIRELNYQPNLAARALVTGKTLSVGLVVPDLVHPFFGEMAKGLSRVLQAAGYGLLIASSEEDPSLERREIEQILARRVDALIVASTQTDASESMRRVLDRRVPLVLVDRRAPGVAADFVGIDDTKAGWLATTHLIQQGCRHIAHIEGPAVSTGVGRRDGYLQALRACGMPVIDSYTVPRGSGDYEGDIQGHKAMNRLLDIAPRPDGVFCYNDITGAGALRAVLDAGLRVPEDVAIIGCGNVRYSQFLSVPLSSVDQNCGAIGEQAARLALALMDAREPLSPTTLLLDPTLVVRRSSDRKGNSQQQ